MINAFAINDSAWFGIDEDQTDLNTAIWLDFTRANRRRT